MAKRRSRTNWLAVMVSAVLLVGMFAVAVFYVERETEVVIADESVGSIEMIPTISRNENGSIEMKMRYITIRENVNVFDYIYENEKIAISDRNHTEIYLLNRSSETENTHMYDMSRIENATFTQVLSMDQSTFENITNMKNAIVQNPDGTYTAQMRTEGSRAYLSISKVVENEGE